MAIGALWVGLLRVLMSGWDKSRSRLARRLRLCLLLASDTFPQLQFEAAWALTNVVSAEAEIIARAVWDAGVLPVLIRVLTSTPHSQVVREQLTWLVGNISATGTVYRDKLLPVIIEPMLKILSTPGIALSALRTAVWTTSNLCQAKKPLAELKLVSRFLPPLCRLMSHSDIEVLSDTCSALCHLTDGPNDRIQAALEAGIVPRLVELLGHHESSVQIQALRTIGNILTGNDAQAQCAIDCGVLPVFSRLLEHQKWTIQKETLWSLSNLCASSVKQLQLVLELGLLRKTVGFIESGNAVMLRREAAFCSANAAATATMKQLPALESQGLPQCLFGALKPEVIPDGARDVLSAAEVDSDDGLLFVAALEGLASFFQKASRALRQGMARLLTQQEVDDDQVALAAAQTKSANGDVQQKAAAALKAIAEYRRIMSVEELEEEEG